MNFLVFNRSAENLKTAIYGRYNEDTVPIATDEQGNFIFSPASLVTVTASNLDIRNLTSARDTVNVTAVDFDIRSLSDTQDSVRIGAKGFVETMTTVNVSSNATVYLLTQEIGAYSQNSYFLRNTNSLLGSVTVALEIAPVGDDDFYISTSATSVGPSSNFLAAVATLMRFARLRVQTGGTSVTVVVYYNARA
ncbi:MAG: DUF6385 domain-containing protein [Christensenellales bacterium]|jgi:hypothetical protein